MSSTTIQPGKTGDLTFTEHMGKGMGGRHLFQVDIPSNDPTAAQSSVTVRSNYVD